MLVPTQSSLAAPAKMPERAFARHASDMSVGESAWTVPWALCIEADRTVWINPSFSVDGASPGGTIQLKITRTKSGFTALLHDYPGWKFDDVSESCPHELPVVELHGF